MIALSSSNPERRATWVWVGSAWRNAGPGESDAILRLVETEGACAGHGSGAAQRITTIRTRLTCATRPAKTRRETTT